MTYEANQTVYHMGQGVNFIAYIGDDRALVEVDVYGDYDDGESGICSHSVTVLVALGSLTDKEDDLWPIAKAERAKYRENLATIKKQVDEARCEKSSLSANIRKLEQDAKKHEALDMILREMNGETTHYIYSYAWRGETEVIVPGHARDMSVEVNLEKSGGRWEVTRGGFRNGDRHYYIPCFGEDDLAMKLVAFCEDRIDCNDRALSVAMEKFCKEHNITSPKITAAIQKRKDMVEETKTRDIAKAEAALAKLQAPA